MTLTLAIQTPFSHFSHQGSTLFPRSTVVNLGLVREGSSERQFGGLGRNPSRSTSIAREHYSSETDSSRNGQCLGPRGQKRQGESILMSQREHTARPASSQASGSPPTPIRHVPALHQSGLRGDGLQDSYGTDRSQALQPGGDSGHSNPPRHFGVHAILNPAESRAASTASGIPVERHGSEITGPSQVVPVAGSGPSTPQPYVFQGAFGGGPQQMSQIIGRSPSIGTVSDRSSPGTSHPLPAIGQTRRILTPRSPRTASVGHGAPVRPMGQALGQLPPVPSALPPRTFPSDLATAPRPEQFQAVGHHASSHLTGGPSARPSPGASYAAPVRSLSQPLIQPLAVSQSETSRQPGGPARQSGPTPPPYGAVFPPETRGFPPPSFPPVDQGWASSGSGPGTPRASRASAAGGSDTQLSFAINPVMGERMIVPVETYSGSKQADEKRQRNAGASARFRRRKKDKEEAKEQAISRLERQLRDLERRTQDIEMDRDRIRSERDRLRDIVFRTPEISNLAFQGPPSPASSRGAASLPGRSSLELIATPSSMPPVPYGAPDPTTGERASQRRRTDPQVNPNMPPYGMAQNTLPAITSASHSSLSQPGTPLAGVRPPGLPPLLGMPPHGPSNLDPGPPGPAATTLPPAYRRESYEMGWATGSSRNPTGPHHHPDSQRR